MTHAPSDAVTAPVYVVEDDADVSALIEDRLRAAGYTVKLFRHGDGLISAAEKLPPALFLLDVMLPGMDGLALCMQIRNSAALASTPVIFVSAKTDEASRIAGLQAGADDYVSKPFSSRELVARIRAVLRRSEPTAQILSSGGLTLDPAAMSVVVDGRPVALSVTEFRVLEFMLNHSGHVFSREQLIDRIWDGARDIRPRAVDVYISRVRKKIEADPENPALLTTVWGVGYRFRGAA
jgi:DNA-binding response OmpR family regulator